MPIRHVEGRSTDKDPAIAAFQMGNMLIFPSLNRYHPPSTPSTSHETRSDASIPSLAQHRHRDDFSPFSGHTLMDAPRLCATIPMWITGTAPNIPAPAQ